MHALDGWDGWGLNGLNQTLHVRNGSAGTSCRLSTFLGSIRCCKMPTFTLSRCGEAVVVSLVCHETSKVARRVSCGRPQPWGVGRFSAHRASAPLWYLDPEMTMGDPPIAISGPRYHSGGRFGVPKNPGRRFKITGAM